MLSDTNKYASSDGSLNSSSGYRYIAIMADKSCKAYGSVGSVWHQWVVYNDIPFSSSTYVSNSWIGSSGTLPTREHPVNLEAGQYAVIISKDDSFAQLEIHLVTETKTLYIDEENKLPRTNEKINQIQRRLNNTEIRDLYDTGISYLCRNQLPDYYFAVPQSSTSFDDNEYLQERISSIPDGKHIIFVTDTHWDGTYNGEPNNNKKSTLLIQYVRGQIGNVDVVFGGDVINANTTKYKASLVAKQYFNECIEAFGEHFIPVLGNHDANVIGQTGTPSDYELPYSELAKIFTDHLSSRAIFRNEDEAILTKTSDADLIKEYQGYFKLNYVINTENGITIIVYNTGAHGSFVRDNFGIHGTDEIYLHQKWLYNALMNVPDGNDVILCGHQATYGISDPASSWNLRSALLLLCGLVKKNIATLYTQSSVISDDTYPWIPSTQYPSYDFSNAPNVGKVFVLQGHWHHDFVIKIGRSLDNSINVSVWNYTDHFNTANGEIPIITTICDAAGQYRNEAGNGYTTDPVGFTMESGTITEQAFDVVTITETGVVTTRFGAAEKPADMRRVITFE